jgi:hypothetical protein
VQSALAAPRKLLCSAVSASAVEVSIVPAGVTRATMRGIAPPPAMVPVVARLPEPVPRSRP